MSDIFIVHAYLSISNESTAKSAVELDSKMPIDIHMYMVNIYAFCVEQMLVS
jgi:hypothetical protein